MLLEECAKYKIREYKKGYNQCLRDRKLTGEKNQGFYL